MTEEASSIKLIACTRPDPALLFISFINAKRFHCSTAFPDNSRLQKTTDDEITQLSLSHELSETHSARCYKKHLGINLVWKPWVCWAGGKRGGGGEFCCARSAMKRRVVFTAVWAEQPGGWIHPLKHLNLASWPQLVSEKAQTALVIPPAKAAAYLLEQAVHQARIQPTLCWPN